MLKAGRVELEALDENGVEVDAMYRNAVDDKIRKEDIRNTNKKNTELGTICLNLTYLQFTQDPYCGIQWYLHLHISNDISIASVVFHVLVHVIVAVGFIGILNSITIFFIPT